MTVVSSDSYNSAHHSPFILIVAFVGSNKEEIVSVQTEKVEKTSKTKKTEKVEEKPKTIIL